jgi:hypothetical protein
MSYNSLIPGNPSNPDFYPFWNFVSNVSNIRRNLESLHLTPERLGLSDPDLYKENAIEKLWDFYKKLSFESQKIADHSWNTQYLKDYFVIFNMDGQQDKLADLYKNHFSHFSQKDRDRFGQFIKLVEGSCQLDSRINENETPTNLGEGIGASPKRELLNAYLSILIAHVQNAPVTSKAQSSENMEYVARWDGSDKMSQVLLNRLESFQQMYSPKADREVELFSTFVAQYPQALKNLANYKQANIRNQLIQWQFSKIQFELSDESLNEKFSNLFSKELDDRFFQSYYKLQSDIHTINEKIEALKGQYGLTAEYLNKVLSTSWDKEPSLEILIGALNTLEQVEQLKLHIKNKISSDDFAKMAELTAESFCSPQGQLALFNQCLDKWCLDDKESKGAHHYDLCVQALKKIAYEFQPADNPLNALEAINQKLKSAIAFVKKQVALCEILEYSHDSFKVVSTCAGQWNGDNTLTDKEKECLKAVEEQIKRLKKQYFYTDNKPKLLQDIKHEEDVLGFFNECCQFIADKEKEIDLSQPAKEKLINLLKGLANMVIALLSLGQCKNFFATQPKETVEVKNAIVTLHQSLKQTLEQNQSENTMLAMDAVA